MLERYIGLWAVRALISGAATTSDVVQSLAWCVGILLAFRPLGVW
jgi:hypothetical protein